MRGLERRRRTEVQIQIDTTIVEVNVLLVIWVKCVVVGPTVLVQFYEALMRDIHTGL